MGKVYSEKYIERKLVEAVKNNDGLCLKLLSDYFTGLPDRLCLLPGKKIAFVELKTTGEKPRKIQLFVHAKLRALGFNVEVIDTVESIDTFISNLKNVNRE